MHTLESRVLRTARHNLHHGRRSQSLFLACSSRGDRGSTRDDTVRNQLVPRLRRRPRDGLPSAKRRNLPPRRDNRLLPNWLEGTPPGSWWRSQRAVSGCGCYPHTSTYNACLSVKRQPWVIAEDFSRTPILLPGCFFHESVDLSPAFRISRARLRC